MTPYNPLRWMLSLRLSRALRLGPESFRLFSLRHEFPNEWQLLRTSPTHEVTLTIPKDRFPFLVQSGPLAVLDVYSALILKEPRPALAYHANLTPPGGAAAIHFDWR